MPAGYAHEVCARKALNWLSPRDREIITDSLPAYLLGAQGPDTLYYYRVLSPFHKHEPNRVGVSLHHQSGAVMARELLMRARGAEPAAAAWALGYLCHWAADAQAHPFILARMGERPYAHGLLEQEVDVRFFQLENAGTPEQMIFLRELSADDIRAVAILFALAAEHSLPKKRLTAEQIAQSIRDMARVHRMIYSPDGKAYRRYARLERLFGKPGLLTSHMPPPKPKGDSLNLRNDIWYAPSRPDLARNESLIDLLENAAKHAARSIQAAISYWDSRISLDEALTEMGCRRMEDGE